MLDGEETRNAKKTVIGKGHEKTHIQRCRSEYGRMLENIFHYLFVIQGRVL
jgi:hypothetical protein